MPVILGLFYLATRRHLHQQYKLAQHWPKPVGVRTNPQDYPHRKPDGSFNDPFNEGTDSYQSFFGRNMLHLLFRLISNNKLNYLTCVLRSPQVLKPDPMVVATKLLARTNYKDTGKQFKIIAASWIQFMIHDWVDLEETSQIDQLTAPDEVACQCPLPSFKFFKTKDVSTDFFEIPNSHLNIRTAWWDASVLYGSNSERLDRVRTYEDGKLKIAENGLLLHDHDGVAISGDVPNSWIGVSTLQALFIKEHNAVCDAIKAEDPSLSDEDLYRYGRLVVSAVIAKIHTIDWTVELLKTDTMLAAMRANWYGLLGKEFKDQFGHVGGEILGGLVGLRKPTNHGVPYSLTEEFGSYAKSYWPKGRESLGRNWVREASGINGHQACGALELWNYPIWLTDIVVHDENYKERPHGVDLAALEEAIKVLKDVYGDDGVEDVDVLVGLMAEKK
ncbi:hypothetical protein VNO78_20257 [Psophocarpus tetragonolobus]|uniref:Uncharacterized protein n=1 Tax=Psophocarpus tetragonolobus TaxID=3891 RepID=A0AAN9S917_PSOTE